MSNLALVPEADVRAMAVYIASLQTTAAARAATASTPARGTGAAIYDTSCAWCHDGGRGDTSASALSLEHSTSVALDAPDNLLRIVLDGLAPDDGEPGRTMPGFAAALDDAQVAALAEYLRARVAQAPPWRNVATDSARIRAEGKR